MVLHKEFERIWVVVKLEDYKVLVYKVKINHIF